MKIHPKVVTALRKQFNVLRHRIHPTHKAYLRKYFPNGLDDRYLPEAVAWCQKAIVCAEEKKRGVRRHTPIRKDEFTKDWYFDEARQQEPGLTREAFEARWSQFQQFLEQMQNKTMFEVRP